MQIVVGWIAGLNHAVAGKDIRDQAAHPAAPDADALAMSEHRSRAPF